MAATAEAVEMAAEGAATVQAEAVKITSGALAARGAPRERHEDAH